MSFDAHTHLDDPRLAADLDAVLARARAAGVTDLAIAGADPAAWRRVEAVGAAAGAVVCLGVHPWWATDMDPATLAGWLDGLTVDRTRAGLGETGLDWHRAKDEAGRAAQERAFRAQIALARERRVPVVLHVVRAHPDARRILLADGLPAGGMVHRFSGGPDQVAPWVKLGMMLSFGPEVIRSERLRAAAARCPSAHLLVETDAPDAPLTPGAVGEPADLPAVIAAIAQARTEPVEAISALTDANARRLFGR
jgi:TatD DNase family protein